MPVEIRANIVAPIAELAYAGGYGKAVRETAKEITAANKLTQQLRSAEQRHADSLASAERRTAASILANQIRAQTGIEAREDAATTLAGRQIDKLKQVQDFSAQKEQRQELNSSLDELFTAMEKSPDPGTKRKAIAGRAARAALMTDSMFTGNMEVQTQGLGELVGKYQGYLEGVHQVDPQQQLHEDFANTTLVDEQGRRWHRPREWRVQDPLKPVDDPAAKLAQEQSESDEKLRLALIKLVKDETNAEGITRKVARYGTDAELAAAMRRVKGLPELAAEAPAAVAVAAAAPSLVDDIVGRIQDGSVSAPQVERFVAMLSQTSGESQSKIEHVIKNAKAGEPIAVGILRRLIEQAQQ